MKTITVPRDVKSAPSIHIQEALVEDLETIVDFVEPDFVHTESELQDHLELLEGLAYPSAFETPVSPGTPPSWPDFNAYQDYYNTDTHSRLRSGFEMGRMDR